MAALTLLLAAIAGAFAGIADGARAATARDDNFAARPEVRAFIAALATNDGFDAVSLTRLFAQVRPQPRVIAAMSRPLTSPPTWIDYAPSFLDPRRVDAGVEFWRQNEGALSRAQARWGVPAEIIVAILGVETYYGRNTGSFRVIDALSTLAFEYPRRADYFTGELRQFLLLCREQGVSPLAAKGSYAGASGLAQFMPGSMRAYAVDFDGDGRIDLLNSADDAIGSVANYLAEHGWQPGQPIWEPVHVDDAAIELLRKKLDGGLAERRGIAAWVGDGVSGFTIPGDITPDPVGLLMLESSTGENYWMVFNNWYVITRYNRSRLYASAVVSLAAALVEAR